MESLKLLNIKQDPKIGYVYILKTIYKNDKIRKNITLEVNIDDGFILLEENNKTINKFVDSKKDIILNFVHKFMNTYFKTKEELKHKEYNFYFTIEELFFEKGYLILGLNYYKVLSNLDYDSKMKLFHLKTERRPLKEIKIKYNYKNNSLLILNNLSKEEKRVIEKENHNLLKFINEIKHFKKVFKKEEN